MLPNQHGVLGKSITPDRYGANTDTFIAPEQKVAASSWLIQRREESDSERLIIYTAGHLPGNGTA